MKTSAPFLLLCIAGFATVVGAYQLLDSRTSSSVGSGIHNLRGDHGDETPSFGFSRPNRAEVFFVTSLASKLKAVVSNMPNGQVALLCFCSLCLGAAGAFVVLTWIEKDHTFAASMTPQQPGEEPFPNNADEQQPVVAQKEKDGVSGDEYERLARATLQKAAQTFGPKLVKGVAVRNILEESFEGFVGRARSFMLNEANYTAGKVLKTIEAEEAMLLLDWNNTIAKDLPSPSAILAGFLSPAILSVSLVTHVLQLALMLLPVLLLGIWGIVSDWGDVPCSIPTLKIYIWTQTILALVLVTAHTIQAVHSFTARSQLRAKVSEVHVRLKDSLRSKDELSLPDLREVLVCYCIAQEHALALEQRISKSRCNTVIGAGTLLWLIVGFWGAWIVLGYTFVPAVVAFHPSSVGHPDYCGLLSMVAVARYSLMFMVLFWFLNLAGVIFWLCTVVAHTRSFEESVLEQAKEIDESFWRLPLAQTLVKALVLRADADTLSYKLGLKVHEKILLERDRANLQKKLHQIELDLQHCDHEAERLKPQMEKDGGAHAASALGIDWKEKGSEAISAAEAKALAMKVEEETDQQLDEIMNKIMGVAEKVGLKDSLHSTFDKAKDLNTTAMAQAQQYASLAAEKAKSLQESNVVKTAIAQASEGARLAVEQSRTLKEKASSLQESDTIKAAMVQASEAARLAVRQTEAHLGKEPSKKGSL